MLDHLINGYASTYVQMLTELKAIGFEEYYNERILPLVEKEIKQDELMISKYNCDTLYKNISKLKGIKVVTSKNYVSFFSTPTCFTLFNSGYLMCFMKNPENCDLFSLTAHEMMHGFADNEVTNLYREYVASNAFLRESHRKLIEDLHSGDEEEFVNAAEYYLCFLAGYDKKSLLNIAKNQYGGACPVSVILFNLLSKEKEIPASYNSWLKAQFTSRKLPTDNIENFIKELR